MAHYPIIKQEVEELLAKGTNEPLVVDAGFYLNVFVVPKCTGGLGPLLHLTQFNFFMHIPSFKMPNIRQICHLIEKGDYAFFLLISRMLIYIFVLLNITMTFYSLVGSTNLISGRFYLFGFL